MTKAQEIILAKAHKILAEHKENDILRSSTKKRIMLLYLYNRYDFDFKFLKEEFGIKNNTKLNTYISSIAEQLKKDKYFNYFQYLFKNL